MEATPQPQRPAPAIRHAYEQQGVGGFYREHGGDYRNPHEPQIQRSLETAVERWDMDLSHVLDLAAGSGEITLALRELGAGRIEGVDPFTFDAYHERTGQIAGRETFEQIAAGALDDRRYSLIACSFALHLLEPSRLAGVAYRLSCIGDQLLILTPHKRPRIKPQWGWTLEQEIVVQRVRSRLYRSNHAKA